MSLTDRAYEIAQDAFVSNEEQIMLRIAASWPKEYKKAIATMLREDSDADPDGIPNLSMVCEVVPKSQEDMFLKDLAQFVREL